MKKIISIAFVAIMTLALFASCSGGGLKDGTYTAEVSDARAADSGHGWKEILVVNVSGGVATISSFDAFSVDDPSQAKSQIPGEEYGMTVAEQGTEPMVFFPEYIANWAAAEGDMSKMDMVAGATNTGDTLKELTAAVMKAAKAGDTEVQIVE